MSNSQEELILVTGGTGLVGSHLLFQLLKRNVSIRATYRKKQTLERVKHVFSYYSKDAQALLNTIEWIEADLNNIPQLQNAFKDVTLVYHCAAMVSFDPDQYKLIRKINIYGTANIVNLSISHQIKKLCYVSSIATIGQHTDSKKLIDERTEWNQEDDNSVYAITKFGAELEVWRGTQEGLNAVIVNPGIILGPGYWHKGGSGSLFSRIYKGLPFYTRGITGYTDIWDVVNIMEQLMNASYSNEKYIVVSENISFKTLQEKTAKALGVKPPQKEAKSWLLAMAWRLDWIKNKVLKQPRVLSKQNANSALSITKYDASKIENTLNYKFKPIAQSIDEVSLLFLKDQHS